MRRMTGWRLACAIGAMAVLAVGCGDDDDDDTSAGGDETEDTSGEEEASGDGGTLLVCTDAPYPPFEFEEDGEFTGFDMELLREISTRLDMELDVTVQPFDGIWLAPAAGTCDLVASAMTITPEREAEALFSDSYLEVNQSLMVQVENEDTFATLEDLAGGTIGVQTGTTGADYASENAPGDSTIQEFDEAAAMFLALESGDIDAILQDFPVNAYRVLQNDELVVNETYPTEEEYGFATAQDNQALIDDINEQLTAVRDDGTYDEIYEEWFGEAPPD
ncbi:MAG: basic amino acid ABC transporter substrate-binding protein [Acidimicrobiales bacterium]